MKLVVLRAYDKKRIKIPYFKGKKALVSDESHIPRAFYFCLFAPFRIIKVKR